MRKLLLFLSVMFMLSCSVDRQDQLLVIQGIDGSTSLVSVKTEQPGENCTNGGTRLDFGIDLNSDGTLNPDEITQTAYVCNGLDGKDGQDGQDGFTSLVNVISIDGDSQCSNGGVQVQTGLDTNRNGELDPSEISTTTFVCAGVDGQDGQDGVDGVNASIRTEVVEPSEEHPYGGYYLYITTANGEEVIFISNGATGAQGPRGIPGINGQDGVSSTITTVYVEPNEQFPWGGYILQITTGDYVETVFISNGADGTNGLDGINGTNGTNGQDGVDGISSTIRVEEVEGGYILYITVGTETTEIFVRDGVDGNPGVDGSNSLVNVLPNTPDDNSTTLQIGVDTNNNGILDASEITDTVVVSNGQDGTNGTNGQDGLTSYVSVEVSLNCENGGFSITSWLDVDGDGVLTETDIVVDTEEICNDYSGGTIIICHEMSGQQNAGTYDAIWNDYDFIELTMTFSEYTYHKLVVHGGQSTQNDNWSSCDPNDGTILKVEGGIPQQ